MPGLAVSRRRLAVAIFALALLAPILAPNLAPILAPAPAVAAEPRRERIEIVTESGRLPFTVEIADTPALRQRGLMYRTELAPDAGMLFLFESLEPQSFWMRNTPLSLDMLFLGPDGRIVDLHERAVPLSERSIVSKRPAIAVLELIGGSARRFGIRIGDTVRHRAFQTSDR